MSNEEEKPNIVSDENWKKQAVEEKQKLSQNEQQEPKKADNAKTDGDVKAAGPETTARPLPPANFMTMVNMLMLQALLYLGKLGDPNSEEGKKMFNPELAKHHIDLLGVLEEKTKGNLTDEENKALSLALHEVRMLYVQSIA
ncbi:MAG: DUF1844 domain-containing protein [Sedimentisphaerales bacterium]|nr:DUF1844 domain-containing protein [Sedimentisphaerales bacterium]